MFKKPFVLLMMTGVILVLFITVYMNKNLNDSSGVQATNGYNLNQLIRIDVEVLKKDGTYEEIKRITEEETIEKSRELFEQITWEPNGEAKLAGPEDVKLTLYFKNDKESTERLTEYLIFLTSSNDSATIISDHPKEGLGTLETGAKKLSDLLFVK